MKFTDYLREREFIDEATEVPMKELIKKWYGSEAATIQIHDFYPEFNIPYDVDEQISEQVGIIMNVGYLSERWLKKDGAGPDLQKKLLAYANKVESSIDTIKAYCDTLKNLHGTTIKTAAYKKALKTFETEYLKVIKDPEVKDFLNKKRERSGDVMNALGILKQFDTKKYITPPKIKVDAKTLERVNQWVNRGLGNMKSVREYRNSLMF